MIDDSRNADCNADESSAPIGDVGPRADRDRHGRFVRGNSAALVVGERSTAFWTAQAGARRDIVNAVVEDAGTTTDAAARALLLAAEGIAQAALMRDSAFLRVIEAGGPMTASGRTRRAFTVWLAAMDRLERHLRLVGLERRASSLTPTTSPAEYLTRAAQAAKESEQ